MFRDYFTGLYAASGAFIAGLQLPPVAGTLAEILGGTRADIERRSAEIVAGFTGLRGRLGVARPATAPAGLNTIGMLCDRLTILAMKEWVLRHRLGDAARAAQLRNTQVDELLAALDCVAPGHSSFTRKLTSLPAGAAPRSWEESYFGLLATNVLLWEAQEVLYGGRIEALDGEELRRYVAWFSEGNLRRNEFIAGCEPTFWRLAREGA